MARLVADLQKRMERTEVGGIKNQTLRKLADSVCLLLFFFKRATMLLSPAARDCAKRYF